MARKPLLAAVGALIALAAVSANPPHPALPPLPGAPSAPPPQPQPLAALVPPAAVRGEPPKSPLSIRPLAPEIPPPSGLLVPIPPTGPIIPPAPQVPRVPADIGPVAPASPPPSQILEPVSAVHRFAGTYLGGTASRAVVYAEANGKAEVLVYALDGAKEPLTRCAVPADKPVFRFGGVHVEGQLPPPPAVKRAFHDGRAFVLTACELTVVGIEGRVEWSFALPGRADNGERFVGLAGFDRGNVLLASTDLKEGGRVYSLNAETGKQGAFWKFEGSFDASALFAIDAQSRMLFAASGSNFWILGLDSADPPAPRTHQSAAHYLSAAGRRAFFGKSSGAFVGDGRELWHLTREAASTGPVGFAVTPNGTRALVPVYDLKSGQHRLAAVAVRGAHNSPVEWTIDVPKAITAPPVARGDSVYFAAGSVLYRANAATGAVHWKHTLALDANDALTGMAFDGDELVTWGGGVVARVSDRGDPVTPIAPAPRERVRQVFHFGPGVFDSQ